MDAFVGKPLTPEKLRRVLLAAGRRQLAADSVHLPLELPVEELDLSLLAYLSDGSEDGLDAQIHRYIAILNEAQSEIANAARIHDFSLLAGVAHRLVGHAKMVNGSALGGAAAGLEAAARSGDGPACDKWRQRVTAEISTVTEAVYRRGLAGQPA